MIDNRSVITKDLVIITGLSMSLAICYTLLYVFGLTGLSKQCRPRWDAAFSPSTLFATYWVFFYITKTCLCNFDPLKPHFYIVKLGFTGVYIIFLISTQKLRLWVLVRTASPRRFYRVPTIHVLSRYMKKYQSFLPENFQFLEVKFSVYLNRRVFVMDTT